MTIPNCVTCRHKAYRENRCIRESKGSDVVTGRATRIARDCYAERSSNRTIFGREKCGPDGRFWEQREPMPPPPEPSR